MKSLPQAGTGTVRPDEYCRYDALGLAELVRNREVSPRELYDVARDAMSRMDETLAFLVGALPEEAERGLAALPADGPFLGVPTLVKDIGPKIAGALQEMGSGLAAGVVSQDDSELIKRYRRAGLFFIGRTATPEMGSSFTTEPRVGRPNRNPWKPAHSTGGSSGGAATAVAAGVVALALAGDSAGSIRVPAHCCGLFGFKPTRAATPSGPHAAEGASGATVAHVITRSVRDSAAALDATFGGDPGCRYVAPAPSQPYLIAMTQAPARLRIALSTRSPFDGPVSREMVAAAVEAGQLCASFGHMVEPADPPLDGDELIDVFTTIWAANMAFGANALGHHTQRKPGPDNLEAANWALVQYGEKLSSAALLAALSKVNTISRAMGDFMKRYDVLLTPSFSQTAPRIGEVHSDAPGTTAHSYIRDSLNWSPFTSQFNLTGQPAMSIPFGTGAQGLPIGVHFAAAYGADETLFGLAGQIEAARPWADKLPPHHITRMQSGEEKR